LKICKKRSGYSHFVLFYTCAQSLHNVLPSVVLSLLRQSSVRFKYVFNTFPWHDMDIFYPFGTGGFHDMNASSKSNLRFFYCTPLVSIRVWNVPENRANTRFMAIIRNCEYPVVIGNYEMRSLVLNIAAKLGRVHINQLLFFLLSSGKFYIL